MMNILRLVHGMRGSLDWRRRHTFRRRRVLQTVDTASEMLVISEDSTEQECTRLALLCKLDEIAGRAMLSANGAEQPVE
jgi:hypothetical protein